MPTMLSPDWKIVIKFTCVSTATLGLRYGRLFKNVVMALSSKAWSLVDPYYTAGIRNFKAEPVELNGVLCKIWKVGCNWGILSYCSNAHFTRFDDEKPGR